MELDAARHVIEEFCRVWCEEHLDEYYMHEDIDDCYQALSDQYPELLGSRSPTGLSEEREELARAWIETGLDQTTQLAIVTRKVSEGP